MDDMYNIFAEFGLLTEIVSVSGPCYTGQDFRMCEGDLQI